MLALLLALTAAANPTTVGGWTITEATDPMTDEVSHRASAASPEGGMLMVSCSTSRPQAVIAIMPAGVIDAEYSAGERSTGVGYRGAGEAVIATLSVDKALGFALEMPGGPLRAAIEADPSAAALVSVPIYRAGRRIFHFDTSEAPAMLARIEGACAGSTP